VATPLFIADLDTLKSRLRLSGVPDDSADTLAILDEAILRARLSFHRRLTKTRVAKLLTFADVADPTTDNEMLRALAGVVEVKLITADLMRRLPASWQDASGDINRRWNEEAPFRERGSTEIEREMLRLQNEIEEDMQMLAGEESAGEETQVQTFDGTPDCTPPRLGASIRKPGRLFNQG
jgi:hypothetical protein